MNKELREDLEHLIICNDKTITQDLRDDVKMTLDYIDELEKENKKLREQCKQWKENHKAVCIQRDNILDNIVNEKEKQFDYKLRIDKAIEYITYEWFKREQIGISHLSFSYDELQHILDILRGEDNESN